MWQTQRVQLVEASSKEHIDKYMMQYSLPLQEEKWDGCISMTKCKDKFAYFVTISVDPIVL